MVCLTLLHIGNIYLPCRSLWMHLLQNLQTQNVRMFVILSLFLLLSASSVDALFDTLSAMIRRYKIQDITHTSISCFLWVMSLTEFDQEWWLYRNNHNSNGSTTLIYSFNMSSANSPSVPCTRPTVETVVQIQTVSTHTGRHDGILSVCHSVTQHRQQYYKSDYWNVSAQSIYS